MNIVIYYPNVVFREIALGLEEALTDSGFSAKILTNWDASLDALYILFGLHENTEYPNLPTLYIAYQFEQLGSPWLTDEYLERLRSAVRVWDYSMVNIQTLLKHGIKNIDYVPLGYTHILDPVPALLGPILLGSDPAPLGPKPIDILFFGSLNDRRTRILDKLIRADLNIVVRESVWNNERDSLIDQAKIVLNIHYYENAILETSRLSLLLNRGAVVVSEPSIDKLLDRDYNDLIYFAKEDDIVETCKNILLSDLDQRRRDVYQLFQKKLKYTIPFKKLQAQLLETGHVPVHIQCPVPKFIEAEQEVLEDGSSVLKLSERQDSDYVAISIITPTRNRVDIFQIALRNFYSFSEYPRDLIEWIIIDDSDDNKLESILPLHDTRIKYKHLERVTPIWEKRNIGVSLAKNSIIVHMDDDDYYFPQSLYAKVKLLQKYPEADCVGSSEIGVYHLLDNYSYIITSRMMPEAGLAYRRSFWESRPFQDKDLTFGEGYAFLAGRLDKIVDFPYWFNFIAITHGSNYTGLLRTLSDRPKAQQNFFTLWDLDTQLFFIKIRRILQKK